MHHEPKHHMEDDYPVLKELREHLQSGDQEKAKDVVLQHFLRDESAHEEHRKARVGLVSGTVYLPPWTQMTRCVVQLWRHAGEHSSIEHWLEMARGAAGEASQWPTQVCTHRHVGWFWARSTSPIASTTNLVFCLCQDDEALVSATGKKMDLHKQSEIVSEHMMIFYDNEAVWRPKMAAMWELANGVLTVEVAIKWENRRKQLQRGDVCETRKH